MFKGRSIRKTITAVILSAVLLISCVCPVFAADGKSPVSTFAKVLDKAWDVFADAVVCSVTKSLLSADNMGLIIKDNRFPTVDEYMAEKHEYFYEGTDGAVEGSGWKLGYDSASVIPEKWRVNADGKADPNGMCLNKAYYFGGYFGSKVNNIYDDERVSLVILSAGNDANGNGIDDLIILASIDNIGVANGNVRDIRKAVSEALVKEKGIAPDDIVVFEFNSTHAHTTIEALGMSLGTVFTTAMKNHFLFKRERSIEKDLYNSICENTAKAALNAYDKMENGTLSYFETENVNDYMKANAYNENPDNTVRDKLSYGADCRQYFSCYYFEGESGEKTMLSNIGLHPTFAGRSSDRVCADVPHYIWKVMADEGYNFVFIQGSQAAIGLSGNYTKAGYDYAEANTLSYDEWVERYGKKYADKRYNGNDDEDGEAEYFSIRATGYSLAHFLIDSIDTSYALDPVYDVKMGETVIPLDYGIMYIAAHGGVFGYNTVKYPASETKYGIVTEIGYVQLGNDVVMLMLPGEVSPALTFGTNPDFDGDAAWQGEGSWTGKAWEYDTIENYAKAALGQDKKIVAMGIANDEIGYVMPDTDCAQNFLTKTIFGGMFGSPVNRADNEELMEASRNAGSALVKGYRDFFAA
ncbi:MAG: hypothetical protein MJ177_07700 [Clostridia bacterium]|nr:hypothetical protein [Clostridia bacterium]